MSSFTAVIPNLQQDGPNTDVQVSVPQGVINQLLKANKPIPSPVKVAAQIDTGASGTVFQARTFSALGLNPVSSTMISTPSTTHPVQANVYCVDIFFSNGTRVQNVFAVEAPMGKQNISGLIGRDVLRHGVLIYIGYANQYTLSF